MLKYVDSMVVFAEVPNEITLAINISNCPCHCEGCHSEYLANDTGRPLNWGSLNALIHINHGISCVSFMGGDSAPSEVVYLAHKVKQAGLKVAWYSGRQELPPNFELAEFDYIKLGPYIKEKGALDKPTTNQKFYKIEQDESMVDITNVFWKQ